MFAWLALDSQISACLCLSGILEDASHHAQLIDFKDATTHFLWFHQHISSVKAIPQGSSLRALATVC